MTGSRDPLVEGEDPPADANYTQFRKHYFPGTNRPLEDGHRFSYDLEVTVPELVEAAFDLRKNGRKDGGCIALGMFRVFFRFFLQRAVYCNADP